MNYEIYVILPCGRRPSVIYNDYRFGWTDFELIKKVDSKELERNEQ